MVFRGVKSYLSSVHARYFRERAWKRHMVRLSKRFTGEMRRSGNIGFLLSWQVSPEKPSWKGGSVWREFDSSSGEVVGQFEVFEGVSQKEYRVAVLEYREGWRSCRISTFTGLSQEALGEIVSLCVSEWIDDTSEVLFLREQVVGKGVPKRG